MEIEFFGEVVAGSILLIGSGLSAYIFKYFKAKKEAITNNQEEIEKLEDELKRIDLVCRMESKRLRKAIVILSKRLDKKTKEAHPHIDSAFEEITRDILTDDY